MYVVQYVSAVELGFALLTSYTFPPVTKGKYIHTLRNAQSFSLHQNVQDVHYMHKYCTHTHTHTHTAPFVCALPLSRVNFMQIALCEV